MLSYPLIPSRTTCRTLNAHRSAQSRCSHSNPATCPFSPTDRARRWRDPGDRQRRKPRVGLACDRRTSRHRRRRSRSASTSRFTARRRAGSRRPAPPQRAAADRGRTGDYLVTARHLDAAFRVDRATRNIDWFVGGRRRRETRLTIVGDPFGGPARPHDARLNGNVLTMMDNRTATGQPSRAVAYRIDEVARTATMLWQIIAPSGQSGGTLGSVRVQPDGSILVGWGAPLQPMFTEHDANGNLTMSITQITVRLLVPHRQVPGHRLRRRPTPRHRRWHRPRPPVAPPPRPKWSRCRAQRDICSTFGFGRVWSQSIQAQPKSSGLPHETLSRGSRVARSENFIWSRPIVTSSEPITIDRCNGFQQPL